MSYVTGVSVSAVTVLVALDADESFARSISAPPLLLFPPAADSFVTDLSVSSSVPPAMSFPSEVLSSSFNGSSCAFMLSPVPVLLNFRRPLDRSLSRLLTGLIGLPPPRLPRRMSETECMRAAAPPVAAMKPGGKSVSSSLSEALRRRLVAFEASDAVEERATAGSPGLFAAGEAELGEMGEEDDSTAVVGGSADPASSCGGEAMVKGEKASVWEVGG